MLVGVERDRFAVGLQMAPEDLKVREGALLTAQSPAPSGGWSHRPRTPEACRVGFLPHPGSIAQDPDHWGGGWTGSRPTAATAIRGRAAPRWARLCGSGQASP